MKIDLKKLKFGHDDAERDAKKGFLGKVFLKTNLYERIESGECELVVGRKGAGKSATCLILKNTFETEGMSVALLTPESLSQQKIQALKVDAINREELYFQTWKYVLLVKISFEFLQLAEHLKIPYLHKQNEDIKEIHDFLKKQGEVEDNFGDKLSGLFNVFRKVSFSFAGFEAAFENNPAQEEDDLMNSTAKLEYRLKRLLKYLKGSGILILIDKVDEVWDDTEESKLTVSGLLRVTHILNESLPNVKIMVFLRSDIFNVLKFHDIDKLNSLSERITWSEDDLKQLIENRVRISTGISSAHDGKEIWQQVFDKDVKSQPSFKYVISRTLRRPRETIQFCNKALRIAQDSKHEKILADDILAAEIQYSTEKIRDLSSEFLVQYPYLDGLFSLFQGFQISFTKQEFELRYQEAKQRLEKLYLDLQSLNSDGIAQILYNIGFLGAEIDGSYVFSYNMPNLTLPQQEKYVVHLAFHSALGIQERIVALNDFQKTSIGISNSVFMLGDNNVAGVIGSRQEVFSTSTGYRISAGYRQEELIDLLSTLEKEFRDLELSEQQLSKALVYIEVAREEVLERDPNKEDVAKYINKAFEALKGDNDSSTSSIVKHSRGTQLALRKVSKWLGVSSSYFDLDS